MVESTVDRQVGTGWMLRELTQTEQVFLPFTRPSDQSQQASIQTQFWQVSAAVWESVSAKRARAIKMGMQASRRDHQQRVPAAIGQFREVWEQQVWEQQPTNDRD